MPTTINRPRDIYSRSEPNAKPKRCEPDAVERDAAIAALEREQQSYSDSEAALRTQFDAAVQEAETIRRILREPQRLRAELWEANRRHSAAVNGHRLRLENMTPGILRQALARVDEQLESIRGTTDDYDLANRRTQKLMAARRNLVSLTYCPGDLRPRIQQILLDAEGFNDN
jgi:hypothetical protein